MGNFISLVEFWNVNLITLVVLSSPYGTTAILLLYESNELKDFANLFFLNISFVLEFLEIYFSAFSSNITFVIPILLLYLFFYLCIIMLY